MSNNNQYFYRPWVVLIENNYEQKKYAIFPEFEEQGPLEFDVDCDINYFIRKTTSRFSTLLEDRLRKKEDLNIPGTREDLEKKYGPDGDGLSFTQMKFNLWDTIDVVYPSEEERNANIKAPHSESNPELNFWIIINEANNDWEEETDFRTRYEIIFPEIDVNENHEIYCYNDADFYEEAYKLLHEAVEYSMLYSGEIPEKWTEEEITHNFKLADKIEYVSMDVNDYIEIRQQYNLKKERLARAGRKHPKP